jgi:hypothetical protein
LQLRCKNRAFRSNSLREFPLQSLARWLLEPVQNREFWRLQRQNSTLQAPKEPENRDFCGLLTAKIHNLNRLLAYPV